MTHITIGTRRRHAVTDKLPGNQLQKIAEQLKEHGWIRVKGDTGSVEFRHPKLAYRYATVTVVS